MVADSPTQSPAPAAPAAPGAEAPIASRGEARSHRPSSKAFKKFITSGWGGTEPLQVHRSDVADLAQARRERLGAQFEGERLVFPAGSLKTRSNDTDYRFRPHSAFAHLTGLGADHEPDAVLVLHPREGGGHAAVLYLVPFADRSTEKFYSDSRSGEFWIGPRMSLSDVEKLTGITCRDISTLRDALAKDAGPGGVRLRVIAGADPAIDALIDEVREACGLDAAELLREAQEEAAGQDQSAQADESHAAQLSIDAKLAEAASELRLIKDAYEIDQMRAAIAATILGFEKVVRALPRALSHERGERVVEATFDGNAREEGNAVGYETIAAAGEHATTLHWIQNTGKVREGELLLLDAGVEVESLYTADVTRTIPVSGRFSQTQRKVYEAVLEAADAAFQAARPGNLFRDVHDAAMVVIARKLDEWGLLPVPAGEALSDEGQQHRRWMVHGTSHHLGIDVHDCAQARREMYLDKEIEEGMIFTIEPGLYFKSDDLTVPEEYRGIGIRIEDDVLITADGNENLSAALPRTPQAVEAWMASLA